MASRCRALPDLARVLLWIPDVAVEFGGREVLMLTRLAPRRAPSPRPVESPELVAFCIVEREDGSATWIRCGRARLNRDGSVNVRLDALPLNGELHLRPARPPPASESTGRPDTGLSAGAALDE